MMRLFVALTLPEEIREALAALENGLPGVRWVPEENLHLTLRFIGEVDGGLAHDIDDTLVALRMPAFALRLSGVGRFGDGRKLRALWAGVEPNPELVRLRDKIERALVGCGLKPEPRKFAPHISLARFKNNGAGLPPEKLERYLAEHALFKAGPFPVEHFTLYSSFLSSSGAIYTPEADYPLEGAAPMVETGAG